MRMAEAECKQRRAQLTVKLKVQAGFCVTKTSFLLRQRSYTMNIQLIIFAFSPEHCKG